MSDSYARLERLRRKRDAETDPEERAAVDEAIAALEEKIRAADATAQPSGRIATVPGHVGFLNLGDIKGNVFINGRRGKEPSKLVEGYLRRLAGHCALLPLQGVREQRAATDTFNLSLNEVYTQLATQSVADRERFQGERLHQLDIVALRDRQREEDLLPVATLTQLRAILPADKAFGGQVKALLEERSQIDVGDAQALAGVHAWTTFDNNRLSEYQANATTLIFSGPQIVTEAIAATQHLALLGEPGSGKSTALRYLALTLARAGLEEHFNPASQLEGWDALGESGRLLPLFLPLLPFARTLADEARKPAGADELWNYIRDRLEDGGRHDGLAEVVHDELEHGNVLLMLDGLDEVAGEASRRQVVRAVQAFATDYAQCRIVVSCRVRAYNGETNSQWRLSGWPVATLADWTPAQMRHFVSAWYSAAAAATGMGDEKREERAESLRRAITVRDDLRRLGIRPLLMTIMALVHFNDQGQLPQERVALYSRCVGHSWV